MRIGQHNIDTLYILYLMQLDRIMVIASNIRVLGIPLVDIMFYHTHLLSTDLYYWWWDTIRVYTMKLVMGEHFLLFYLKKKEICIDMSKVGYFR